MQSRKSSLYHIPGYIVPDVPPTPVTYFKDVNSRLNSWKGLSLRTPTGTGAVGKQYIHANIAKSGSHLQWAGHGYCGASNGTTRADYWIPKDANPYPVQGFFGISIHDLYRLNYYTHYTKLYIRCNDPPNFSSRKAYISFEYYQKAGGGQNNSQLAIHYDLGLGGGLQFLDAGYMGTGATGPIRIETQLDDTTLWIALDAPTHKIKILPVSIDVTGSELLNRTNILSMSRTTRSQTNVRVTFPIVVDNTRKLLI